MKLPILVSALVLLLTACGDKKDESKNDNEKSASKIGDPEEITVTKDKLASQFPQLQNALGSKLESTLGDFAPSIQVFKIDPTANNSLETNSGVLIDIPANAFSGNIGSSVEIYFKEALNAMDAMLSGLQTLSDRGPLASDGMFYIEAQSGGESLKLAADKKVMLSIPASSKDQSDYQVFEGQQVPAKEVVWKASNQSKIENYLIPFPPKYLTNGTVDYYEDELGQYRDRILHYSVSEELKDIPAVSKYNWWKYEDLSKYNNSLVVTREFASMFEATSGISIHDEELTYYLEHSDLPLWQVDSMYWPEYDYKDRKHGKVIKLDYEGVDLSENGHKKLANLGLSEDDIRITLQYYKQREEIMRSMDDKNDERRINNYNRIMIGTLGWINIDKYLDLQGDPLLVNIKIENSTENTQVYLVNLKDRVVMRANQGRDGFYFGNHPEDKIQIPEPAGIFAFDVIDGQFYSHISEPKWYAEDIISISLEERSEEEINDFFEVMKNY